MEIEHTDFALDEILERLSDLFASRANDKDIELLFSVDPRCPTKLYGDPLRISQVLTNLLSNALKFTEQGEIMLSVDVTNSDQQQVELRFSVTDSGIGISEEQQQRLFKAFSQADSSTTRRYGGTGLGLTISQHLVQLMGGTIGVDSKAGQGATFHFNLPLQVAVSTFNAQLTELEGLPILVVDDNHSSIEVLTRMLSGFGFEVYSANSGLQALTSLDEIPTPKLIISDYRMPQMDGLELVRQLKQRQLSPAHTIMLTAHSDQIVQQQTTELGIGAVLTKPTNPSTLLDTIQELLGNQPGSSLVRRKPKHTLTAAQLEHINGKRVLLVEDNLINQQVARELLLTLGLRVDIAEHGQVALKLLETEQFDLILMDCQMPVLDGYQTTMTIRSQLKLTVPIIAMTANAMQGDRERCLEAGMDDHFAKPIDIEVLHQMLWQYLGQSSEADAHQQASATLEQAISWPQHPLLDVDRGLQLVGGSSKLYQRLLLRFSETQQSVMSNFHNIDFKQQQYHAHVLKGLCGSLASPHLVNEFDWFEQLSSANQIDEYRLAKLTSQTAELIEHIEKWGNPQGITKVESTAPAPAAELMPLRELLEQSDPVASDLAKALSEKYGGLTQLNKLISNYQFDEALEELEQQLNRDGRK